VALVLAVVAAGVMLLNSSDDADSQNGAVQSPDTELSPEFPGSSVNNAEAFTGALRSLESAAPFMVESESVIPSQTVGGTIDITWPPYNSESLFWQMFPDAARGGGMPEGFGMGDDFEDRNCAVFESGSVCDRVWKPSGETLGISTSYGARHFSAGIFVSPDEYRTRRQFVLNPELKAEITRRGGRSDFSDAETIYEFRQEDGLSYAHDGIKRSPSPFAEVAEGKPTEGSLYAFLMTHLTHVFLYQFLEFSPTDIVDAANFSGIERVTPQGETDGEGLIHYRAGISDFLGDEGIWDMWISPADGLPRRISIEAFSAPDDPAKPLDVTRATLTFSRFGEEMGIYDDLLSINTP
jgi:hypothetical protein